MATALSGLISRTFSPNFLFFHFLIGNHRRRRNPAGSEVSDADIFYLTDY